MIEKLLPKTFEKVAKEIAEEVKKASPNLQKAVINYGRKNRIEGASGFRHQIDVSIEIPGEKLFLVECKRYKSKVTLSHMLVLIARIDDICKKKRNKVSGIFFTTIGYTKPAKEVGSYYNIELNTVKDIKYFAVQVAGNVFVKAEPIEITCDISGNFLTDQNDA
jgi:hypothetical protein